MRGPECCAAVQVPGTLWYLRYSTPPLHPHPHPPTPAVQRWAEVMLVRCWMQVWVKISSTSGRRAREPLAWRRQRPHPSRSHQKYRYNVNKDSKWLKIGTFCFIWMLYSLYFIVFYFISPNVMLWSWDRTKWALCFSLLPLKLCFAIHFLQFNEFLWLCFLCFIISNITFLMLFIWVIMKESKNCNFFRLTLND